MSYFSTSKVFLVPSFDLDEKERQKIDRFLLFLDDSGVGDVIAKYVRNGTASGGRPNRNYYRLFATILYGFAFDRYTVRDLEAACRFDLRYITLMEQTFVDYSTIAKFINKVIVPNEEKIFSLLCRQIAKETGIRFEDAFIDGTKIEANANKYKFVWKPVTFHRRISASFFQLIRELGILKGYRTGGRSRPRPWRMRYPPSASFRPRCRRRNMPTRARLWTPCSRRSWNTRARRGSADRGGNPITRQTTTPRSCV